MPSSSDDTSMERLLLLPYLFKFLKSKCQHNGKCQALHRLLDKRIRYRQCSWQHCIYPDDT